MNFKKGFAVGLAALGLSLSAQASDINIGGVVWDPEAVNTFPSEIDFTSSGILTETTTTGIPGDIVGGWGYFTSINSVFPNMDDFCPGCELTFTFSMTLASADQNGTKVDFAFDNLTIDIFVDDSKDFADTAATAGNGDLWLRLVNNGNLVGDATDFGTGSDKGDGEGNLDVVQGLGLAWKNFDTNARLNNSDFVFSSSFQPVDPNNPQLGLLRGDFQLTGDSIPEPTSIALLGLGMLGFAAARKRKA